MLYGECPRGKCGAIEGQSYNRERLSQNHTAQTGLSPWTPVALTATVNAFGAECYWSFQLDILSYALVKTKTLQAVRTKIYYVFSVLSIWLMTLKLDGAKIAA